MVENDEWLEHFRVVLWLLHCPTLQRSFGRKKYADLKIALLHSTFLCICIVNTVWVDTKILVSSLAKLHEIHN